ncbi:MAG: hypothetical protein F4Z68_02285 [Nitrospira sp. SB0667_bin_9]|nr:hypothetical protein [Nitrospira sp. SB0667_bin_9]
MDIKRFFVYAIVIAALALAGCSSDGNGGDIAGMPDPPPPPPEPTVTPVDLTDLPGVAIPTNTVINAGESMNFGTGQDEVTISCPSGGENCSLTQTDDSVTSTGGMATAMLSEAAVTARRNAQMAMTVAATKAAETKADAIETESKQTADAGLGGSARTDEDGTTTSGDASDDVYTLEISRGRSSSTEIKITDPALAGANDPKFKQAMDLGGGTTMHVRTMKADEDGNVVEEVVVITTDIDAAKAVSFGEVENQSLHLNPATTGGTTDFRSLQIAAGGSVESTANTIDLMKVRGPDSASPGATQVIPYEDDPGTPDMDERRFTGTYNGAPGRYTCSGTSDCTATVDDKGVVSELAGDSWIFTPDSDATSDVPDSDYLHYGFWLKKTTDSDDVLNYDEVETFAGSSIPASGALTAVLGTATYSGGATGVYVSNILTSTGDIESSTSGHFTADAKLTAIFGQVPVSGDDTTGTIADNLLYTLTGIIDEFKLSGHDEGPGWSVVLDGDIGEGTGAAATASGTAKGGSPLDDGSFSASFHGDVTAVDGVPPKPSSVVGEFNSFFTDGSVAGAFGAREDQ